MTAPTRDARRPATPRRPLQDGGISGEEVSWRHLCEPAGRTSGVSRDPQALRPGGGCPLMRAANTTARATRRHCERREVARMSGVSRDIRGAPHIPPHIASLMRATVLLA